MIVDTDIFIWPSDEEDEEIEVESYRWSPNFVKYFDNNTHRYEGTVIGNTPLELQLQMVKDAGTESKELIFSVGESSIAEVRTLSEKFKSIDALIANVSSEILKELGGGFILGVSILDDGKL